MYPAGVPERGYQLSIIRTALLNNTLVCLPTGLGKTLIAAVVMYNFTRWFPEARFWHAHVNLFLECNANRRVPRLLINSVPAWIDAASSSEFACRSLLNLTSVKHEVYRRVALRTKQTVYGQQSLKVK